MSIEGPDDPNNELVNVNEENVSIADAPATSAQIAVLEEEGVGEDDEIDDEAIIEGAAESSVQIAPTDNLNPSLQDDNEPPMLGDHIVIDSKYGRTEGIVYYNDAERMSIKPFGVSNMVQDFEMTEEGFDEEDGVTAVYIIKRRDFDSFVEQQDFRVGNKVDLFDVNGSLYKKLATITKVDKENDSIELKDPESEEVETIAFDFIGIPSDQPFKVISITQQVEEKMNEEPPSFSEEKKESEEPEVEEEEEGEEEDEIEEIGFVTITRPKIIKEAASFEQRIPDSIQKIDALNDFISGIDASLQKDPKAIRAIRVLVETLFHLKQASIEFNEDGTVRGEKSISATYLSDLIQKTKVAMGRPVLRIQKKEYYASALEQEIIEETMVSSQEERKENLDEIYFTNFVQELANIRNGTGDQVSAAMEQAGGRESAFWKNTKQFLEDYVTPWRASGNANPYWKALEDSELFRVSYPELIEEDDKTEFMSKIYGYTGDSRLIPVGEKKMVKVPIFYKVPYGMERALTTTYRKGAERKKQTFIGEESAVLNNYILFPAKLAPYLGSSRSNNIAVDSGRAQLPKKTMKSMLVEFGGPKEIGNANDIILLDAEGKTLGNIPIDDYLEGTTIPALGLGDTFAVLGQYGMYDLELTPTIVDVLNKKIEKYQAQLLSTLNKLRETINEEKESKPETNSFLVNPPFLEEIRNQVRLADALEDFRRIHISLADSDIAKVNYLLKEYPDYLQVAAGKDGVLIAKARLTANNKQYVDSRKIAMLLEYNRLNAGQKPQRNTCKHVADFVAVRRIFDDEERFQKLTEKLHQYQGQRDKNWINCNLCREHLLCVHERLQIEAFLKPKEKTTLEKEIILKFSGGQFQGQYICRNCGQPIRALDFDNNIEFDDNGKPKSGRAVLEDKDALFVEKIENLINVPIEATLDITTVLSDNQKTIYNIVREITERIGINLTNDGYMYIIDHVTIYLNKLRKQDDYEKLRAANPKLNLPTFKQYRSTRILSSIAVYLLLEIQTRIPSYIVRYSLIGCASPGFDGYPLSLEPTKKQGIEYIACAISSIRRNDAPWNETGFQTIANDIERQKRIITAIDTVLKDVVMDGDIQYKLTQKRNYLVNVIGSDPEKGRPNDVIPATFLPQQIIVSPEEAAKEAIQPEVAANMGPKGKLALVKLWIRQSHALAKQTASLVRDSQFLNTTCCLSNIRQPSNFWDQAANLPPIGKRVLTPYQQGQFLITNFIPREGSSLVAEPDEESYFRIFLKCCFKGPRMGYAHEPGLDNMCAWCGFQFPTIPAVMDTDGNSDTEGKSALVSQNVDINENTFTTLLDKMHEVNKVQPLVSKKVVPMDVTIQKSSEIQPPPVPIWNELLLTTYQNFSELPPDAEQGDIALAAADISNIAGKAKSFVERYFKPGVHDIMDKIVKLPWINFFQILQTYFIVQFERKLVNYNPNSLFVPYELEHDLSESHVKDAIEPIINIELELLKFKQDDFNKERYDFARSKMRHFVNQLSAIVSLKNILNLHKIPFGKDAQQFIQEIMFYGPLATLLDSSKQAPSAKERLFNDPSEEYVRQLVRTTLEKFNSEFLAYDDKKIKEMIEIRNEKERTMVLDRLNKMSDEEKQVELITKNLRMGKWSIGGRIHAYDGEIWEIEQQQRREMGITDFPEWAAGEYEPPKGVAMDEYGNLQLGDDYYENEGGYDVNQHGYEDTD
jgi:hypothetical protein